jgi:hypothetical protein
MPGAVWELIRWIHDQEAHKMEARTHSASSSRRKSRKPSTKPANGPVTVTYVNPLAIAAAREIVADPTNSYTVASVEKGEVWTR